MRKFLKLSRDTRPQEQPPGTYPFGKNGIQNFMLGAVFNEPGFLPSSAVIPYVPNGVIETDMYPIIFSTNNVNSAIGYYDVDNDVYKPILDDASLSFKLGFSTDRFITGVVQRNYKGELVGAFTDKYLKPFYLNFDNPDVNSLKDMLLFLQALAPDVTTEVTLGGTLLPGAYYTAVKLLRNDGAETSYLTTSSPKIITGTASAVTDKALEVTVTNVDPDYDQIQIAVISKINGVLKAVQLSNPLPVSGNGTILYTGAELTEDITLEEILVQMKPYDRVGCMGQLNDSLYIMELESAPEVLMQKYASMVRLKWKSQLITVDPVYEKMKTGEEKSLMHEEVMAAYIRYKLNDGTTTKAFTIPGPALTSADRATSSTATAEGFTAKKFQVDDTIDSFDPVSKTGYFGKWENATETYPNLDEFDASAVGGEDLRGQPVRHHRTPSIRWCKENLYAGEVGYGRDKLDMMGIVVENVIIPSQYADKIVGWEIFYAKRSIANSTVLGQSLLLFGARSKYEANFNVNNYYSSGGNFNTEIDFKKTDKKPLYMDQSIFHFHAFDILFNKPSLSPQYLSLQLKQRQVDIPGSGGFIEDLFTFDVNDGPAVYLIDYMQKGISPTLPSKKIKGVKSTQYVPNNTQIGKWQNQLIEGFFGGVMNTPEKLIPDVEVSQQEIPPGNKRSFMRYNEAVQHESTFLTNLMALREDLYVPFNGQSLVRAGSSSAATPDKVLFGGDTYICEYTFHTYGWWVSDSAETPYRGTKIARRFICETASNLYSRYEDPANVYSRFFPKSALIRDDLNNYLTLYQRDKDPNQFGYSKDSNALDDLFVSDIYNPLQENLSSHIYRVHRGGKLSRQTKQRNWRTFLPLDYYEMPKNMGRPIHLEGMDDRLILHFENAIFVTQDKTKLESDIISVTLGSGDIFQFVPQEGLSSKLGYGGTQHQLACVRTPFGYVFIDSKQGQIFLYKGQLELINNYLNQFLLQFMRLKDRNVFAGNGYTIGYDPTYKRILVTAKNRRLTSGADVKDFNPADLPSMPIDTIVRKNGRLQKFMGINNPVESGYDCPGVPVPVVADFEFTIAEDASVGSLVGTVSGTNVDDFYINGLFPFSLDPVTGKLVVAGVLDYTVQNLYTIPAIGVNDQGTSDNFTITVHLTAVNKPPVVINGEAVIYDDEANGTAVFSVVATDREGDTLTYAITGGNVDDAFAINATTGVITVNDNTQLNALNIPKYLLQVSVSDSTHTSTGVIIVNVLHVNRAPVPSNYEITIKDTTADNTVVLTMDPAEDLENDLLVYQLIYESVPGVFEVDLTTLTVKLKLNSSLNPAINNLYTLTMSVSDDFHPPVEYTITIHVEYDRKSIAFEPAVGSCVPSGSSCPSGYTLSSDGTTCTRVTTIPADVVSTTCYAASTNGVYNSFFSRIYKPGFANSSIASYSAPTSDVFAEMSTAYWTSIANAIGVWVDTDCDGIKDALAPGAKTTILYNFNNIGAARTVYVGVFGDNQFKLKVNDMDIATTLSPGADMNFKVLHIFPVDIVNGQNLFNVEATGDGSVNDAVGMIIYDNTPAEIQAAVIDADLNIVFSSVSLRGSSSVIATCPTGYVLDVVAGAPICKKIENTPPSVGINSREWSSVQIKDKRLTTNIALAANVSGTPRPQFQGIDIPYYAPVTGHVDCGGTETLYLSAQKSGNAQKNNCAAGIGSLEEYTVPQGSHSSTVSQAAADALAQAEVDAKKQIYANDKGTCTIQ